MATGGFWTNLATGMANSPMLKGSLLGNLIGAAPGIANKFANRGKPTGLAPNLTGATVDAQTGERTPGGAYNPPSVTAPSSSQSDPNIGGDMARPSLLGPGNRTQMIDMGPAPTRPGFKFPSAIWTE